MKQSCQQRLQYINKYIHNKDIYTSEDKKTWCDRFQWMMHKTIN